MSDGSANLTRRDPQTFESLGEVNVTYNDQPIERLNELECVGDTIWANVWQTNYIIQIDKQTGAMIGFVDAAGLLTRQDVEGLTRLDVLNGIAYNAADDTFYITGKLWPLMFEVNFVEIQRAASAG